jgi:hypothetical protein
MCSLMTLFILVIRIYNVYYFIIQMLLSISLYVHCGKVYKTLTKYSRFKHNHYCFVFLEFVEKKNTILN